MSEIMKQPKICVYTIALNEIKHVDKFMEANKGADLVLVADTGSTDGTVERLRELGAVVYSITQKPWRFDVPRNTALSLVPPDYDICLSIDLDEYLQEGWVEAIRNAWQKHSGNIKRISYEYTWNWKADGTPDMVFFTDKIHHRHGYIWKHPCHETLYWEGDGNEYKVLIPELKLHHHADQTKSRGQYLNLLKLAVDEDPSNDRMRHYYARELMFFSHFAESIEQFKIHLANEKATWKEERCASLRYMARCYLSLGDLVESKRYAILATLELPTARDPWLELARSSYADSDWKTCFWAATKCLEIKDRVYNYTVDASAWGSEPYDLAGISAWYCGFKEKSKEYCLEAYRLNPNDERLKNNCKLVESA